MAADLDPLRAFALQRPAAGTTPKPIQAEGTAKPKAELIVSTKAFQFQGWKEKRAAILKKYTTNQEVAVSAEFLEGTRPEESEEQKLKKRVAELEEKSDDQEQFVSQRELIKKLEQQNQ